MSWIIRLACAQDLSDLYDFYAQIGRKETGYFEACLADQDLGGRIVFLAYAPHALHQTQNKDVRLAGYVILNHRPLYALYHKMDIPEIQDLNVAPAYRKQGLGSALIAHCEDWARSHGKAYIGISVGLTKDYGAAQILYVKRGYVPDGNGVTYAREPTRHGEIRPIDDDLCLMFLKDLQNNPPHNI